MTLLIILNKSGFLASVKEFSSRGLASQAARQYVDSGVTCRIVPEEMREDVEYLMSQIKEQRQNGFVKERGVIPNGRRSKGASRSIGNMIYPAFGGMLEDDTQLGDNGDKQPRTTTASQQSLSSKQGIIPLTFSSGDLILPRKN